MTAIKLFKTHPCPKMGKLGLNFNSKSLYCLELFFLFIDKK